MTAMADAVAGLRTRRCRSASSSRPERHLCRCRRLRLLPGLAALAVVAASITWPWGQETCFTSLRHPPGRALRHLSGSRAAQAALRSPRDEPMYSEEAWSEGVPSNLRVQDLEIGEELTGIVVRVTDFGCFVDVGADRQGLVHSSRLSKSYVPVIQDFVQPGQTVQVWVRFVSPQGRLDLTMFNDAAAEETDLSAFDQVGPEQWLEAEVTGLSRHGAMVSVTPPGGGETIQGMIHISQLSDGFVEHADDIVQAGQMVKARLIGIDRGRLRLSLRQSLASPRRAAEEQDVSSLVGVSPSKWFKGRIDHTTSFGIFVEVPLPDGSGSVQGLVHKTQYREGFVRDIESEVDAGQEVEVRVIGVDTDTGRVSLSMLKLPEAY